MKRKLTTLLLALLAMVPALADDLSLGYCDGQQVDEYAFNNTLSAPLRVLSEIVRRKVLVEEFTGQQCSNCPAGRTNIEEGMKDEDHYVMIAHHTGYGTVSPHGARHHQAQLVLQLVDHLRPRPDDRPQGPVGLRRVEERQHQSHARVCGATGSAREGHLPMGEHAGSSRLHRSEEKLRRHDATAHRAGGHEAGGGADHWQQPRAHAMHHRKQHCGLPVS